MTANVQLSMLAGFGAALCLGVGDFAAQRITVDHGWRRALLAAQLSSLPLVLALAWMFEPAPALTLTTFALLLGIGSLYALGITALYRAFAHGPLSIVSPIASSFAAVTIAFSLIDGQHPAPKISVLVGLAIMMLGVAVAIDRGESESEGARAKGAVAGMLWAGLSSLTFGAMFYGMDRTSAQLGVLWPLVAIRASTTVMLLVSTRRVGAARRPPTTSKSSSLWIVGLAVGLLDSGGILLYTLGTRHGHVEIVVVLTSLFSIVTVTLAQLRLRERLTTRQWIGVLSIIVGIAWTTAQGS